MNQMDTGPKGYDANKSQVSTDSLAEFVEKELEQDINSVPGIGQATGDKLIAEGIDTTYQLLGQFLSLKGSNMTSQEHCDKMWYWLKEIGVNTYRSGIIQCLSEKCEIMMPYLYQNN